jgi:hypothetical protein
VYATHNGAVSEEVHIIVGAALSAPIVDPVNPGDTSVTGEGVPGATITVTDPEGNVLGTGTVDPDGTFNVTVP